MPISTVIIVALFAVQWRGTGSVGRIFGPVMMLWFLLDLIFLALVVRAIKTP